MRYVICILTTVVRIKEAVDSDIPEVRSYLEGRYFGCRYKNYPRASKILEEYVSNLWFSLCLVLK